MRSLAVVVGLIGVCLASGAMAQDVDCENAMTQIDMNFCAQEDFARADDDLNEAYGRARDAMRDIDSYLDADLQGAEEALRDAQRAWITFRDTACAAEGFMMRGGSAEPLLVYGCMARLTDHRTEDLETLAAGAEG